MKKTTFLDYSKYNFNYIYTLDYKINKIKYSYLGKNKYHIVIVEKGVCHVVRRHVTRCI